MVDDNGNPIDGSQNLSSGRTVFGTEGSRAFSADLREVVRQIIRETNTNVSREISNEQIREIVNDPTTQRSMAAQFNRARRSIESMPAESKEAIQAIQEFNQRAESLLPFLRNPEESGNIFSSSREARDWLASSMESEPIAGRSFRDTGSSSEQTDALLRYLRAERRMGSESVPDEFLDEARQRLQEAQEEAARQRPAIASASSAEEYQAAVAAFDKASNQASGLENVIEYWMGKQGDSLNNVMSFVSNVLSTLAVGQLAVQFQMQDPFQYRTAPALQTMGNVGEGGAMLSQAIMQEAQYDLRNNVTAANLGMGAFAGGSALLGRSMSGGRGLSGTISTRGGRAGLALTGLGAAAAYAGFSGSASDMFQELGIAESEEDIIGVQLARQIMDANRLSDYYTSSRAGLLQAGAGPNLGFTEGGGNQYLQNLVESTDPLTGASLIEMGIDDLEAGRRLSSAAMQLRGRGESLNRAVQLTGALETTYGVSPEQTLGNLASIQRAGFEPGEETRGAFFTSMGAVAEPDGGISTFAMNVLVPALNQVLESTAIQNSARSTEELQREVYGFRQTLAGAGEDRLGELISASPEAYNRIFSNLQQNIKQSARNPASLAFYRSLGLSYEEIYSGSPQAGLEVLNVFRNFLQNRGFDMSDTEALYPYAEMIGQTGLTLSNPLDIVQLLQRPGDLTLADVEQAQAEAEESASSRYGDLPQDLQTLLESMATQTKTINEAMLGATEDILEMQGEVQDFLTSDRLDVMMEEGKDTVIEEFRKAISFEENSFSAETVNARTEALLPQNSPSEDVNTATNFYMQIANRVGDLNANAIRGTESDMRVPSLPVMMNSNSENSLFSREFAERVAEGDVSFNVNRNAEEASIRESAAGEIIITAPNQREALDFLISNYENILP